MDEILIEERKYISSKQAAKLTGYAKDYVGQLCREGRLPARLIGRSWYVLESAIQDHRFGVAGNDTKETEQKSPPKPSVFHTTWESPRYEAVKGEELPLMDYMRTVEVQPSIQAQTKVQHRNLQAVWQDLFDNREIEKEMEPKRADKENEASLNESNEMEPDVKSDQRKDQGNIVPVRTRISYKADGEDLRPQKRSKAPAKSGAQSAPQQRGGGGGKGPYNKLRLISVILALVVGSVSIIGSGYFDKYVISFRQTIPMTGIYIYNK